MGEEKIRRGRGHKMSSNTKFKKNWGYKVENDENRELEIIT